MSDEPLLKSIKRAPLWNFALGGGHRTNYGREEIQQLIPHRPPFLLIDGIAEVELKESLISGWRFVDPTDPVFKGHFPNNPLYPGVLQIETMAQMGLCLMHFILNQTASLPDRGNPVLAVITKLQEAGFPAPVLPGYELTLYAKLLYYDELMGVIAGQIYFKDELCSYAILEACFHE